MKHHPSGAALDAISSTRQMKSEWFEWMVNSCLNRFRNFAEFFFPKINKITRENVKVRWPAYRSGENMFCRQSHRRSSAQTFPRFVQVIHHRHFGLFLCILFPLSQRIHTHTDTRVVWPIVVIVHCSRILSSIEQGWHTLNLLNDHLT